MTIKENIQNSQLELKLGDKRIKIDASMRWYCQVPRGWQQLTNADKIVLYGLSYLHAISESDSDSFGNVQLERLAHVVGLNGSIDSNRHKLRQSIGRIEQAGLIDTISNNRGMVSKYRINLANGFVQAPLLQPRWFKERHSVIGVLALLEAAEPTRSKAWTHKRCYGAIQEVADNAGVSLRSLYRWLNNLRDFGVLQDVHSSYKGGGVKIEYWLFATRFNGTDCKLVEIDYRRDLSFEDLLELVRRRETYQKCVDNPVKQRPRGKPRVFGTKTIYKNTEDSLVDIYNKPNPTSTQTVQGFDLESFVSELFEGLHISNDSRGQRRMIIWLQKHLQSDSDKDLAFQKIISVGQESQLATAKHSKVGCLLWRLEAEHLQDGKLFLEDAADTVDYTADIESISEHNLWNQFLQEYKSLLRSGEPIRFEDPEIDQLWTESAALRQAIRHSNEYETRRVFWEEYKNLSKERVPS